MAYNGPPPGSPRREPDNHRNLRQCHFGHREKTDSARNFRPAFRHS